MVSWACCAAELKIRIGRAPADWAPSATPAVTIEPPTVNIIIAKAAVILCHLFNRICPRLRRSSPPMQLILRVHRRFRQPTEGDGATSSPSCPQN
jgi:hypothetical protein